MGQHGQCLWAKKCQADASGAWDRRQTDEVATYLVSSRNHLSVTFVTKYIFRLSVNIHVAATKERIFCHVEEVDACRARQSILFLLLFYRMLMNAT
jgi:hypothetical protein